MPKLMEKKSSGKSSVQTNEWEITDGKLLLEVRKQDDIDNHPSVEEMRKVLEDARVCGFMSMTYYELVEWYNKEMARKADYMSFNMVEHKRGFSKAEMGKVDRIEEQVKNDVGVEVVRIERGSRKSYPIHGVNHTKFFMWAGANGWSVGEVQTALKSLNIPEISILSIRTFLYAGKAEGKIPGSGGRGGLPTFTHEQSCSLNRAAGRAEPVEEVKKVSKKGKKSNPK